jgi:formiminoglutamase
VRRLLDAGLPGGHVVQIGIADFANSADYAARARDSGVTVIGRDELRRIDVSVVAARALAIAGDGGRPVYVDLDVDVCDRAEVPGCPASAPGGISADDLRQIAFLLATDTRVAAVDITEIDSRADTPDGRTVRLGALLLLEAATGLAMRRRLRV